uniref:Uncharacterized protein n=1 Tax=Anopheles melas TaxID=34690 RepID=A0A182UCA5_9DIPT
MLVPRGPDGDDSNMGLVSVVFDPSSLCHTRSSQTSGPIIPCLVCGKQQRQQQQLKKQQPSSPSASAPACWPVRQISSLSVYTIAGAFHSLVFLAPLTTAIVAGLVDRIQRC